MESPWTPKPCENGHVFIWASNDTIDTVAPKGTRCNCGACTADGKGGIQEKLVEINSL
jgi:hypothetical protein